MTDLSPTPLTPAFTKEELEQLSAQSGDGLVGRLARTLAARDARIARLEVGMRNALTGPQVVSCMRRWLEVALESTAALTEQQGGKDE